MNLKRFRPTSIKSEFPSRWSDFAINQIYKRVLGVRCLDASRRGFRTRTTGFTKRIRDIDGSIKGERASLFSSIFITEPYPWSYLGRVKEIIRGIRASRQRRILRR